MEPTIHVPNIDHETLYRIARREGACRAALDWLSDGEKDFKTAYAQVDRLDWARYFINNISFVLKNPRLMDICHSQWEKCEDRRNRAQARWVEDTTPFWAAQNAAFAKIEEAYKAKRHTILQPERTAAYTQEEWAVAHKAEQEAWNEARNAREIIRKDTDKKIRPAGQRRHLAIKRANAAELKFYKSLLIVDDTPQVKISIA